VCSAALSLMIGVLTRLAAAGEAASITTIKLALPLLKGMLSAAIGGGSENDLALTTMGAAYTAASLLNLGEESAFSADIAKDKISSLARADHLFHARLHPEARGLLQLHWGVL